MAICDAIYFRFSPIALDTMWLLKLLMLLGEKVLEKVAEYSIAKIPKLQRRPKVFRDTSAQEAEYYAEHVNMVQNWASEISFNELRSPKQLLRNFVDLDLHLGPLHNPLDRDVRSRIKASELIQVRKNFIIVGDAGAGKTTSLKRIALDALHRDDSSPMVLLILLRDHTDAGSLAGVILSILGVSALIDAEELRQKIAIERQMVLQRLRHRRAYVLIDGLDEVPPYVREAIISDLRFFLLRLSKASFVLTCRTGDYHWHLENASLLAILPLTAEQVEEFTDRWLGIDVAAEFRERIKDHPYSGSEVRPLTLAHLCAIYERTGAIPDKPRFIYRMIVQLLLKEWDMQRSVRRYSEYATFDLRRKEEFLEAIAYEITSDQGSTVFSQQDLEQAFSLHCKFFGMSRNDAASVAEEIASHTGLIVKTAYGQFSFAHKAIQEYLAASYLLKLDRLRWESFRKLPNETALLVALSSNPSGYFSRIYKEISHQAPPADEVLAFVEPYVRRLLIERVDFLKGVEFGGAVVGMYSIATSTRGIRRTSQNKQPATPLMDEFVKLLPVRESVAEFLASAQVKEVQPEGFEVTARIRSYAGGSLELQIPRTFRINKTFFEMIHGLPPNVPRSELGKFT